MIKKTNNTIQGTILKDGFSKANMAMAFPALTFSVVTDGYSPIPLNSCIYSLRFVSSWACVFLNFKLNCQGFQLLEE